MKKKQKKEEIRILFRCLSEEQQKEFLDEMWMIVFKNAIKKEC